MAAGAAYVLRNAAEEAMVELLERGLIDQTRRGAMGRQQIRCGGAEARRLRETRYEQRGERNEGDGAHPGLGASEKKSTATGCELYPRACSRRDPNRK